MLGCTVIYVPRIRGAKGLRFVLTFKWTFVGWVSSALRSWLAAVVQPTNENNCKEQKYVEMQFGTVEDVIKNNMQV